MKAKLNVSQDGVITLVEQLEVVEGVTIPRGFKYIEGTVETGLVIENKTDKNQFVWVPKNVSAYNAEESYEESGYTEEKEEFDAMVASVEKYGGFYIGRYEASLSEDGKAQSIAGVYPCDNLKWGDSMTDINGNGAAGKARAVYPASKATTEGDAVSTLVYGSQWNATVSWLDTKYSDISSDSTGYGNYGEVDQETGAPLGGTLKMTGSNPSYALNKIYMIWRVI